MLGGAQRQVNVRVLEAFMNPFRHRAEQSLAQVSVDGAIDATAVSHSGTHRELSVSQHPQNGHC